MSRALNDSRVSPTLDLTDVGDVFKTDTTGVVDLLLGVLLGI